MDPTPGPGEARSQTVATYEVIRREILAGRLPPAQRLKIATLCERLGVSLGVVREALSRLSAEGLVIAEPQRGFQVSPISREDLIDLGTMRVEIESVCLRRAIERGDLAWESQLVAAFHQLTGTPERVAEDTDLLNPQWTVAHGGFHEALVQACGSQRLLTLRRSLYEQAERYRHLSAQSVPSRDVDAEHRHIFEATMARDSATAVALIARHIQDTTESLLETPLKRVG